jgi:hypothetical protein
MFRAKEDAVSGKSLGKTVLGWFVVQEGDEERGQPTSEELIAKYGQADPAAAPLPVQLEGDVALPAQGGAIDFPAVYRAAQISEEQQNHVDRACGLLQTLPSETPKEVRRQIVEASLRAFGLPVDRIIESAAQEIQALEAYIRLGERDTQNTLAEGNKRLQELTDQMALVKRAMEDKVLAQQSLTKTANEQKLKVQIVLEFFGQEAVAKVVKESPKLVEPQ